MEVPLEGCERILLDIGMTAGMWRARGAVKVLGGGLLGQGGTLKNGGR